MSLERARLSLARLREVGETPVPHAPMDLDPAVALELFESQLLCRLVATDRELKAAYARIAELEGKLRKKK